MPIVVVLAIATLCGCAGMQDSMPTFLRAGPWWQAAQTTDIRARARALEEKGELAMALDHWRLAERIAVDQTEVLQEISRLERKIAEAVQFHYQNGLAKMGRKEVAAARNHFLTALRLDPAFEPAQQQIKANFSPFPLIVYRTIAGDRPDSVAKNVFGDADKAFLVAWFNDLPEDEKLPPDTVLILPKIEKPPVKKARKKKPPEHLAAARSRLAADDLEGAQALVDQMDITDPGVQSLIHTIHLRQAVTQTETGRFEAARHSLASVPDDFMGKNTALEALQAAMQRQESDRELEKARTLFDRRAYQQSLDMAESVTKRDPERLDAHDLVNEARYRLALDHFDHGQWLMARNVLAQADEGHAASMDLKETVHTRLMEQAQIHYRNGVKHFINEDLKAAVAEWEKALACNPDHKKARENTENARRIMQKIEKMP